jgi:hypothetical protein
MKIPSILGLAQTIFQCLIRLLGYSVAILAATLGGLTSASATPCSSGTLDTVLGTECDIGDKTFNFSNFMGEGITSSQIELAVDSSNPLAPGFTLTGVDGPISFSAPNSRLLAQINFTVSTVNGAPTLLGTTVTLNDPRVTGSGSNIVDAFDFLASDGNRAVTSGGALPEVCIDSAPTGGSACAAPPFPATLSATGDFNGPVSSTSFGQAGFTLLTSTGTATFVSADFRFNQSPVPEPEAYAMFLLGLSVLGAMARRRQRCKLKANRGTDGE